MKKFIGFSEKMAWLFYEFIMKAASLKAAINREFWSKIPCKLENNFLSILSKKDGTLIKGGTAQKQNISNFVIKAIRNIFYYFDDLFNFV